MKAAVPAALARREFLKFITASPYVLACGGVAAYLPQALFAQSTSSTQPADTLIGTAAEAKTLDCVAGSWAKLRARMLSSTNRSP